MTRSVDGLRLRKTLGRKVWCPAEPFGPDGWKMVDILGTRSVIVTAAEIDGVEFIHASIAYSDRVTLPTYDDLKILHQAAFNGGYAYQVFAPPSAHINIHPTALHLWGRVDGMPILPEFGSGGTI